MNQLIKVNITPYQDCITYTSGDIVEVNDTGMEWYKRKFLGYYDGIFVCEDLGEGKGHLAGWKNIRKIKEDIDQHDDFYKLINNLNPYSKDAMDIKECLVWLYKNKKNLTK